MHSVGALQSASSKNRVGEQATCNVWQLQLSRLSVYVCVYVMGVCVCVCLCFVGVHCVIIVVIVVSSEPSRDASWSTCYCLPSLPACHPLSGLPHAAHTHTIAATVCGVWNVLQVDDACSSCVKWAPLGARRIWGWVQCLALFIPAPCAPCVLCASLCCGMKVKFCYTARTAAEWQWQWHRPRQKPKSQWSLPLPLPWPWPWPWPVCGMHSDIHAHTHTAFGSSRKRGHTHRHMYTHTHTPSRIMRLIMVRMRNVHALNS